MYIIYKIISRLLSLFVHQIWFDKSKQFCRIRSFQLSSHKKRKKREREREKIVEVPCCAYSGCHNQCVVHVSSVCWGLKVGGSVIRVGSVILAGNETRTHPITRTHARANERILPTHHHQKIKYWNNNIKRRAINPTIKHSEDLELPWRVLRLCPFFAVWQVLQTDVSSDQTGWYKVDSSRWCCHVHGILSRSDRSPGHVRLAALGLLSTDTCSGVGCTCCCWFCCVF